MLGVKCKVALAHERKEQGQTNKKCGAIGHGNAWLKGHLAVWAVEKVKSPDHRGILESISPGFGSPGHDCRSPGHEAGFGPWLTF